MRWYWTSEEDEILREAHGWAHVTSELIETLPEYQLQLFRQEAA